MNATKTSRDLMPGDRLKEARIDKMKIPTASEASRRLNLRPPTYLAHENNTRSISPGWAERYAKAYGISPNWLLFGTGPRDADPAAAEHVPSDARSEEVPHERLPLFLIDRFDVELVDGRPRVPGGRDRHEPTTLPSCAELQGYLPELVPALPEDNRRRIVIQGLQERFPGQTAPELALDDFTLGQPNIPQSAHAFVVRLHSSDAIDSANAGDYVIVDPDDAVPSIVGFYCILRRHLDVVLIEPHLSKAGDVIVRDLVRCEPLQRPRSEVPIIGRVVSMHMAMTKRLVRDLAQPLLTSADRTRVLTSV